MITVMTEFALPRSITREEARRIFLSTAPSYREVPGLVHKTYLLSKEGTKVGGVYLWTSRSDAEALFSEAWHEMVMRTYGIAPTITYFESPVMVDNANGRIVTDA